MTREVPVDGPVSLDDVCPVDYVGRCDRCGKVHFVAEYELGTECGPDFGRDRFCPGRIRQCNDHDALLAAYKLGGEEAAVVLLFQGCKGCIAGYWYGNAAACPDHT